MVHSVTFSFTLLLDLDETEDGANEAGPSREHQEGDPSAFIKRDDENCIEYAQRIFKRVFNEDVIRVRKIEVGCKRCASVVSFCRYEEEFCSQVSKEFCQYLAVNVYNLIQQDKRSCCLLPLGRCTRF